MSKIHSWLEKEIESLKKMITVEFLFQTPASILGIELKGYNFDTVLYQLLETRTSDRTNIGPDQLLKCLDFSLCPL